MTNVLVLTHGELAQELVRAARSIAPQLGEEITAMALPWEIEPADAAEMVRKRLKSLGGRPVLVLTDMFGGTATNLALPLLKPGEVEVVTGANLPMLVKLASLQSAELPLHELAVRVMQAGQKSIHVASEFLRGRPSPAAAPADTM